MITYYYLQSKLNRVRHSPTENVPKIQRIRESESAYLGRSDSHAPTTGYIVKLSFYDARLIKTPTYSSEAHLLAWKFVGSSRLYPRVPVSRACVGFLR